MPLRGKMVEHGASPARPPALDPSQEGATSATASLRGQCDRDIDTEIGGVALSETTRIDSASRVILATPRALFRTFLDAEQLAYWRTPDGMTSRIAHFDPRVGGGYAMTLRYGDDAPATIGKTRAREDEVEVRFLMLAPEEQVVEEVHFISTDPAFAGPMTLTTSFEADRDGTRVTLRAENVPETMAAEDHKKAMLSSLNRLARLTE